MAKREQDDDEDMAGNYTHAHMRLCMYTYMSTFMHTYVRMHTAQATRTTHTVCVPIYRPCI